ncbi:MAG: lipid-binding SYLF domain-containing protein [Rhodospirillaceae bacterium]|nr:lipid-binding SYLF domain-containing protein [Rhodospirillaceae bacterium]
MRSILASLAIVVLLSGCSTSRTPTLTTAQDLIADSVETLAQFNRHKTLKDYHQYLDGAAGVVILPAVLKVSWVGGAETGDGVLLARKPGGGWTDPTFHTMVAASIGMQVGIQDTAIILILRSEKAVNSILKHQGKFGADMGATAVFSGVGGEASTTSNLGADIVAFAAPNIGAYVGGSLEGAVLVTRRDYNELVYGAGATPDAILAGRLKTAIARPLQKALGP